MKIKLLSKNKNCLLLLFVMILLFSVSFVQAATITSKATGGNWDLPGTWVGGVKPAASDNVVIATTGTNKVTLVTNTTCANLTINTGAIVDIIDKDLTVSGDILLNGICKSTKSSPGKIEWNKNGGTLDGVGTFSNIDQLDTNKSNKIILATANITFTNASIDGEGNVITNNGIVNISGSNGFAVGSTTTWSNIRTLNYGSPTFLATLIATAIGNTVNYTGTAQIAKVTIYDNLTLSGSGTKTFATTPTINGVLSLEGTAIVTVTTGVITYGAAATLQYNKPAAYTATLEEWPATFSGTGGVIIANTGIIKMNAAKTISMLLIDTGAKLNLGIFTHAANTLTLGDSGTVLGSWGSSSSAATNKDDTYFSLTAGILNVSASSCTTTTYDGTTWSKGPPTLWKNIIFSVDYSSPSDMEGCSCKVNSGAAVVFKTGSTLKITNEVKVLGPSGFLTFENNASLVQINDAAVNNGNITYMRKTNSVRSSDYTYWSSPVAGQLLKDVSPSYTSGMFYSFNTTIGNWVSEATSNVMEVGKGYIIRGPRSNLPPAFYDASFIGIPNNGPPVSPITIGAAGTSNLIGNPYPSALDADAFLNANSTMLEGTIYFWTHNTAIQLSNSGTAYVYTSNDYASYNGVGGVATLPALSVATGGLNTTKPSGKIAAGQSFFATSKAAGTAIFNNSMRVGVGGITGDNAQFFKINTTKAKSAGAVGKNRIWLNLTNSQGAFKQALVGYVTGATNGYDGRFDGESFDGNTFIDFYSVNQDKNLAIQGRALPFDEADTVPLGYKTTIVGNFTIAIDQTDGFFTTQNVFIEDKLLNTTHDLKEGPYTFSTVKGVFNDRFVLRYTNKTLSALGTQDFTTQQNQVLVSNKNKQIKINTDVETIDKVQVYDLLGKQIYQKTNVDSNELAIADLVSSHQVLVVKTVLQNGQTITKKIIF